MANRLRLNLIDLEQILISFLIAFAAKRTNSSSEEDAQRHKYSTAAFYRLSHAFLESNQEEIDPNDSFIEICNSIGTCLYCGRSIA